MGSMAGLMHSSLTAGQALSGLSASPMAASPAATGSSNSSSSSSSTISANDFLTLLVTEMRNQDPTADTDPNAYINQLIQVNSLEQLIDINQNLSKALGDTSSTSSGTSSSAQAAAGKPGAAAQGAQSVQAAGATAGAESGGAAVTAAIGQFAQSALAKQAAGNLGIPTASTASQRVAHSLDGHLHAQAVPGQPAVSR